jgi:hypothetical protein
MIPYPEMLLLAVPAFLVLVAYLIVRAEPKVDRAGDREMRRFANLYDRTGDTTLNGCRPKNTLKSKS